MILLTLRYTFAQQKKKPDAGFNIDFNRIRVYFSAQQHLLIPIIQFRNFFLTYFLLERVNRP